jgi:hypothetical protein
MTWYISFVYSDRACDVVLVVMEVSGVRHSLMATDYFFLAGAATLVAERHSRKQQGVLWGQTAVACKLKRVGVDYVDGSFQESDNRWCLTTLWNRWLSTAHTIVGGARWASREAKPHKIGTIIRQG